MGCREQDSRYIRTGRVLDNWLLPERDGITRKRKNFVRRRKRGREIERQENTWARLPLYNGSNDPWVGRSMEALLSLLDALLLRSTHHAPCLFFLSSVLYLSLLFFYVSPSSGSTPCSSRLSSYRCWPPLLSYFPLGSVCAPSCSFTHLFFASSLSSAPLSSFFLSRNLFEEALFPLFHSRHHEPREGFRIGVSRGFVVHVGLTYPKREPKEDHARKTLTNRESHRNGESKEDDVLTTAHVTMSRRPGNQHLSNFSPPFRPTSSMLCRTHVSLLTEEPYLYASFRSTKLNSIAFVFYWPSNTLVFFPELFMDMQRILCCRLFIAATPGRYNVDLV